MLLAFGISGSKDYRLTLGARHTGKENAQRETLKDGPCPAYIASILQTVPKEWIGKGRGMKESLLVRGRGEGCPQTTHNLPKLRRNDMSLGSAGCKDLEQLAAC